MRSKLEKYLTRLTRLEKVLCKFNWNRVSISPSYTSILYYIDNIYDRWYINRGKILTIY